jgi:hypothetical protein
MENMSKFEWQGKRKDQVEFSAKMIAFSMIGILISTVILIIKNIFL